jgi:hypothetical protein
VSDLELASINRRTEGIEEREEGKERERERERERDKVPARKVEKIESDEETFDNPMHKRSNPNPNKRKDINKPHRYENSDVIEEENEQDLIEKL